MIPPKVVAPPKRSLQESDMFLAAFDTQDKKAAGTKRLKANKVVKILQPDVPTNKEVAVKSDFNVSFISGDLFLRTVLKLESTYKDFYYSKCTE